MFLSSPRWHRYRSRTVLVSILGKHRINRSMRPLNSPWAIARYQLPTNAKQLSRSLAGALWFSLRSKPWVARRLSLTTARTRAFTVLRDSLLHHFHKYAPAGDNQQHRWCTPLPVSVCCVIIFVHFPSLKPVRTGEPRKDRWPCNPKHFPRLPGGRDDAAAAAVTLFIHQLC